MSRTSDLRSRMVGRSGCEIEIGDGGLLPRLGDSMRIMNMGGGGGLVGGIGIRSTGRSRPELKLGWPWQLNFKVRCP